jgi:tetratricopeptide (TPR) repeat protein
MSNGFGFGGKKSKKSSSKNEPNSSRKNRHIDNHTCYHKDDYFWYTKGLSLVGSKNHEEAIIAFNDAVLCNPQNCYTWNSTGNFLYELKSYEIALTAYDRAIDIKALLGLRG